MNLRPATPRPAFVFGLLLTLCLLAYAVTIPLPRVDGMLIGSDGIGYFMYVHSMVIDGDLDFHDEYARLGWPIPEPTPTGLLPNHFAIGAGLLWAPFFLMAHGLSLTLRAMGMPVSVDGYGYIYQGAVALGSILYGGFALWLMYCTVRRFSPRTALPSMLLIWFGTNLIYYQIIEPSMSHMCSLFATALFVFLWVKWRGTMTPRHWFMLGAAGGLIGLVRQPDATFLILPVLDAVFSRRFGAPWSRRLLDMIVYGAGFLALFWIQLAAWWIMYGSPFSGGYLYGGKEAFNWANPQMIPVLFSLWHGLFVWHPVYLLGVIGLVPLARRDWPLALACAIGFVLQVYVISSWWVWTQGDSFGGRMFIATLPLLALGLTSFFDWLGAKGWRNLGWVIAILLVIWNGLFLIQYRMRYISFAGPITFEELTVGKWWMLQDLWQKLSGKFR